VKLGGAETTAGKTALQLLAKADAGRGPGPLLPSFARAAGGRRKRGGASAARRTAGGFALAAPAVRQGEPAARTEVIMQGYGQPRVYSRFLTFPVLDRDRVYVQAPYTVAAIGLADGKPVWTDGEREGGEGSGRGFRGGYYRLRSQPQG